MNKTKEELDLLKKEYSSLSDKLKTLTEDELKFVIGGDEVFPSPIIDEDNKYSKIPIPIPTPFKPIVSKKCQHKPCSYTSLEECPYYNDEIDDCVLKL